MKQPRWWSALAVLGGVGVVVGSAVLLGAGDDAAPEVAARHEVRVLSLLEGPRIHYFEGALVQVVMESAEEPSSSETREGSGTRPVGGLTVWPAVEEGPWRLTGATRPCSGNCGELGPVADACVLDLEVTGGTTVLVRYRWGSPCQAEVLREPAHRLEMPLDHCWIEPVVFDGAEWAVVPADQIGWGEGLDHGWLGQGRASRVAEDLSLYADDGGRVVRLVPADTPAAAKVFESGCD